MDNSLETRLERLRKTAKQYEMSTTKIAAYCVPTRNRTTVAKVVSGSDPRYLTEGNVSAIETAIEKILQEYRQKLCP
jgi:hypothetical protein